MSGTPDQELRPFGVLCRATTNGTTAVDVWGIPEGTVISGVLGKIKTPGTGSGNITIGDDDTADGFILAADATAAADTVYGDVPTERGAFLYDSTVKAGYVKVYTATTKEVKMDCSAALTTEAVVDVFIWGWRYSEN